MINSITYSLFPLETCLNWNKSYFESDFLLEMHYIVAVINLNYLARLSHLSYMTDDEN